MNTASDRRAPHASRVPFDAMVEVGGTLGPSFEAQAVNVSEEGMHLRTAYLPDVGQPVTCRFDAGQGLVVVAAGEVLWRDDLGDGGEFGIRFTNLDAQSSISLQRIVGLAEDGGLRTMGRKVRLHIEGLASPMRARVKSVAGPSVTAFSELGFLQVGKQLDLEDTQTGSKRPALIDRVDIEMERETRIPQLVVTLRYDDEEGLAASPDPTGRDEVSMSHQEHDEMEDELRGDRPERLERAERAENVAHAAPSSSIPVEEAHEEENKLKSAFARSAAKVGPALEGMAKRAKTTLALLVSRNKSEDEAPVRRTTAPAPGGGLHAAGRKVIRGDRDDDRLVEEPSDKPGFKITKKKMAVAGAVAAAAVLAIVALRKPAPPAPLASAPPVEPAMAAPPPVVPTPAPAPMPVNDPLAQAAMGAGGGDNLLGEPGADKHHKKGKVAPFGNGHVGHGNVLRLKMDGPIEKIQGAAQPAGFTVVIPGRKAAEGAAPLASRDPRIAAIKVSNEAAGAELTVSFKDGVPNYLVRAKGDQLEMVLARQSHPDAHAKKKKKH